MKTFHTLCISMLVLLLFPVYAPAQDAIDVAVKGISDDHRDGAQKDRQEAILDAKRQALEMAGLKIEAKTTVENFQTVYDRVETQAAAVLLPGFQVIDNGYGEDGTYTVVLVGKVRTAIGQSKSAAEFNIIIWIKNQPEITKDRIYYIDKLYSWLDMVHGEIRVNDLPLDSFEKDLILIFENDSLLYGNRKVFAYQYRFPTGKYTYTQRTPNMDGSVSEHDFSIRIRAGKKYVMDVAHDNAVYFNEPRIFEDSVENVRLYKRFPDNFTVIFQKP
jgi:hypothetical protein